LASSRLSDKRIADTRVSIVPQKVCELRGVFCRGEKKCSNHLFPRDPAVALVVKQLRQFFDTLADRNRYDNA